MVKNGLGLWLLLFPFQLLAQSFAPDPDWRFENFNSQNHFTSLPVSQLVVDRQGYVWASANGLFRFDGNHTIEFTSNNRSASSLRGNYPAAIPDNSHNIWITCYGLCRYDAAGNKFVYVKTDPGRDFKNAECFCTQRQYLWFICEFGLTKFDTKTLKFSYTSLTHVNDPLCSALINDSTVFISSREKVYYYNIRRDTWTVQTLVYNHSLLKIFNVHKVRNRFFLGTNNGLFVLDGSKKITALCPATRDVVINDIAILPADSAQKYLFLASEGSGLQVYNTALDKIQYTYLHDDNNPYSIPCNGISSFFVDEKGRLWISCDIGISMLDLSDQRFKMRFLDKSNAYQLGINKIAADKFDTSKIWLSSYNQGMICVNWKTRQVDKIYNKIPYARRLYDFVQLSKNRWLLATQKELTEWSPERGPLSRLRLPVPDSIALICNIRRLILADANTCYITTNLGLFKYDLSTRKISVASATSTTHKGSDPLKYILLGGYRDKDVLWIASRNGTFKYNLTDGRTTVYRGKGSPGDYFMFDIADVSPKQLVFAAGEGIGLFDKETGDTRIINALGNTYKPGCNSIIALNNTVWVGTDAGIFTYDLLTNTSKEGELSPSLNVIAPSSPFALIGKYIVYGFRNGFAYFSPETKNTLAPSDPIIERVYVNDQPVLKNYDGPGLTLGHSNNSLNFTFTAFLYNYPDDIRFRYRLAGTGRGWQNADNQRGANYSQLPPGDYTFFVQCGSKNGVWNNHLASFSFTIMPPYWASWWFRLLVAAAVVFVLYRLYRYKIEHIKAIEKIRANIAADFHDDLGSTLSSISIFSEVAIQKSETDLDTTRNMVGDIGVRARAMIHSMNDMVWIIKPDNDSLYKLMQRMEEFGYPVAEAKEIPLKFVMDKAMYDVKIDMLHRKNLFLIFKEAFNNAVKYASATEIRVEFELKHRKTLMMQIVDNGSGFELAGSKKGNGLGNMQRRATEIKGKLKIETSPGCGTSIRIECEIT